MSSESDAELHAELLDDFYAECDELLGNIRTHLTELEQAASSAQNDPVAVEALYRNIHSLKGIAAIVGLRVAERVAHAAEGLLRDLSHSKIALAAGHVDTLAGVMQRLEQIVTAHRLKTPLPEIADVLVGLNAYDSLEADTRSAAASASNPPAPLALNPELAIRLEAAEAHGLQPWRATFSPSQELDLRGVNINSVRARFTALGQIVHAAPSIQPGGVMKFEFTLALREVPTDLAAWEADGIMLQSAEPTKPMGVEHDAPAGPSSMFVAPSHIVRVDLSRLDELMRITGEMVIHRSRLEERIARASGDRTALQEVNLALGRSLRELREALTRVRLVPISEIFARMPFVLRDLARDKGRKVRLALEGQHTEIDKYLVERLKEPLLHLVRNAVSHGVESPEERVAAGKPAEATLLLRASTIGQSVVIQIRDDGRGVDARQVAARAAESGMKVSENPNEHELLSLLCQSGFSTKHVADRGAGRGVGMAVVHSTVRELGGTLSLETTLGEFTQFTLRLPLTLSIAETFIVSVAGQTCAVPQGFVEEIILISEAAVRTIQKVEVVSYRDGILPLVRLREMFRAERSTAAQVPVLVLSSEQGLSGLVVDRVEGQREVVVRSMRDPLIQVPGISGATELGDGRPVLILDAALLAQGVVRPRNVEPIKTKPAPVQQAS